MIFLKSPSLLIQKTCNKMSISDRYLHQNGFFFVQKGKEIVYIFKIAKKGRK